MGQTERVRLLLVDDEADFRASATRALKRQGFEVIAAASGREAIALATQHPVDVVILDLKMEGMDGIATLEQLRVHFPELPTFILTGHSKFEDAVLGIELRVVDFIQKPVDLRVLGERIRQTLAKEHRQTLRERTLAELTTPAASCLRVKADDRVRDVIAALRRAVLERATDRAAERKLRTVLVYDQEGHFSHLIRIEDIIQLMLPPALKNSPYASYFTGMFLGQSKVVGALPISEIPGTRTTVDIDAPLMEAVHLMVERHLTNLPVLKDGRLVGVLRDEDVFLEIADAVAGPASVKST
jgi:DNA-binding response OmpR family regulator